MVICVYLLDGLKGYVWWVRKDLNPRPRDYGEHGVPLIDSQSKRNVRVFLFALSISDPDRPYTEMWVG